MISNPIQDNFSFLLSPIVGRPITMGSTMRGSKEEVLLGVRIDSDLTFKEHITIICSKINQKRHSLTMVSKHMNI